MAKTSIVGDAENWTPQQALDTFYAKNDDASLLYYEMESSDRENYLISGLAKDAVDYRKNTCDFGGDFLDMLESIRNLPEFSVKDQTNDKSLIDNTAIVSPVTIFGINCAISYNMYAEFGGEDITFVGYPSVSGKGYITEAYEMIGITEMCPHKEEAFELVSLMLTDKSVNAYCQMGIPITEKALQEQLKISKYTATSINAPVCFPMSDTEVYMPESSIKKVVDYIRGVEFEPYANRTVNGIIHEEYMKCFDGEISPQECAENLNTRVNLYLSENE